MAFCLLLPGNRKTGRRGKFMLKKGIEILALVLKLIILIIFAAVRIIAESAVGIILSFLDRLSGTAEKEMGEAENE
jgi:hypothetical protein